MPLKPNIFSMTKSTSITNATTHASSNINTSRINNSDVDTNATNSA